MWHEISLVSQKHTLTHDFPQFSIVEDEPLRKDRANVWTCAFIKVTSNRVFLRPTPLWRKEAKKTPRHALFSTRFFFASKLFVNETAHLHICKVCGFTSQQHIQQHHHHHHRVSLCGGGCWSSRLNKTEQNRGAKQSVFRICSSSLIRTRRRRCINVWGTSACLSLLYGSWDKGVGMSHPTLTARCPPDRVTLWEW